MKPLTNKKYFSSLPVGYHKQYELQLDRLPLNLSVVERSLGYANGKVPEFYSEKIAHFLVEARERAEIKAGFLILAPEKFNCRSSRFEYGDLVFRSGKIICGQLQKSETVAVFACTAGAAFDRWSKELFDKGDYPGGYVVDCLGSEIVESAADWLEDKLAGTLSVYQLSITNRFSPGYCGWNVREQHKLFSLLPANFCGITLTESALMLPMKSVSGVIGIGRNAQKEDYPCATCTVKNCYRRKDAEKSAK